MLWRHVRREVTHCELFESMQAPLRATGELFARHNRTRERVRSIIGVHAAYL
jgi:hypothetical protein